MKKIVRKVNIYNTENILVSVFTVGENDVSEIKYTADSVTIYFTSDEGVINRPGKFYSRFPFVVSDELV